MKKISAFILALVLLMTCTACAGTSGGATEDEHLAAYAGQNGVDLNNIICSQLILVCADGTQARVDCYERNESGIFAPQDGLTGLPGYISEQGLTDSKTDGDTRTPVGLHIIGHAFGCSANPGTELEYVMTTESSCWVTDCDSPDYNTWLETDDASVQAGSERFALRPEKYEYALIVSYNIDPVIKTMGTAFFFHCGTQPTDGGIALDRDDMCAVIRWLRPEGLACVLICRA